MHIFVVKVESYYFKKEWELEEAQRFDINELPSDIGPATRRRITEYKSNRKNFVCEW